MKRKLFYFESNKFFPPPLPARKFIDDESDFSSFFVMIGSRPINEEFNGRKKFNISFTEQKKSKSFDFLKVGNDFINQIESLLFNNDMKTSNNFIQQLYKTATALSQDKEMKFKILQEIIQKFKNYILTTLAKLSTVNECHQIGDIWADMDLKEKLLESSSRPIISSTKTIREYTNCDSLYDYFEYLVYTYFNENLASFDKISEIVTRSFLKSNNFETDNLCNSFQLLIHSNQLFSKRFLSKFISSIIDDFKPVIGQLFEQFPKVSDYFSEATQIQNTINAKLDLLELPSYVGNEFRSAFDGLIFADHMNTICKRSLRDLVLNKDFETLKLCAELARSTDKITSFAHELSFDIESAVEGCFKLSNPIIESMQIQSMLKELNKDVFNYTHGKMLKDAFEKGFNNSAELAARLLAEAINQEFIKETFKSHTNDETNSIFHFPKKHIDDEKVLWSKKLKKVIDIFRILTCKDVFEAYHFHLLTRRILMLKLNIIKADEAFTNQLRTLCGSEYTKRIDGLFNDLSKSSSIFHDYVSSKFPPRYFKALVLSHELCRDMQHTPLEPPQSIRDLLTSYAQFFCSKNKNKKIEWNHVYSRVKLRVNNKTSIKQIECNGVAAAILCLFNYNSNIKKGHNKKYTVKEIIDLTKANENVVEESIRLLRSKKLAKIIIQNKNNKTIKINKNPTNEGPEIVTPFISMSVPHADSEKAISQIEISRSQQLDAAIMLLLKKQKTVEKIDLKNDIRDLIHFRLDDEFFEKELENLSKKLFLKLDPTGRVHYLP